VTNLNTWSYNTNLKPCLSPYFW